MVTVYDKKFGCNIRMHRQDHIGSDATHLMRWDGLSFAQYTKWLWYFRYRAALEQVKHPRNFIELAQFSYEYVPTEQEQQKRLKDKITAKKAKLTTWLNKLKAYEAAWNSLFPVTEDTSYQLAQSKIDRLRRELSEMEALTV